jgi:hypothetical protein
MKKFLILYVGPKTPLHPFYNQVGIQSLQGIYACEPQEMVVGNFMEAQCPVKMKNHSLVGFK